MAYYDLYHPVQISKLPDNIVKSKYNLTNSYVYYPRVITNGTEVTYSTTDLIGVYVGVGMASSLFSK